MGGFGLGPGGFGEVWEGTLLQVGFKTPGEERTCGLVHMDSPWSCGQLDRTPNPHAGKPSQGFGAPGQMNTFVAILLEELEPPQKWA